MDEAAVPPPEPNVAYKSPAGRPSHHILRAVIPIVLVVAMVVVGLILAHPNNKSAGSIGTAHLLVDDRSKAQISLTDTAGKTTYNISYPKFSYVDYQASSPQGKLLLSSGAGTPTESFLFAVNGKLQSLPAASLKALHSSSYIDNMHDVYFLDENNVVYTTCDSGSTCKVENLDLSSGKAKQVVDTGAKSLIPQLPSAYLIGLSSDRHLAYVHTMTANKLGKDATAIYAIDLNGKVKSSWSLPNDAGYSVSLAPDTGHVVFKTGTKSSSTVVNLDLHTKKSSKVKWTKGEIVDQPSTFVWSPDSKKVFFWGSDSILPRQKAAATFDINSAYLDITSNQIVDLQTVKDSAHNQVADHGWLDSDNVVYEQNTASQAYSFSSPTPTIYKQNVKSKAITKFNNLPGILRHIVYY